MPATLTTVNQITKEIYEGKIQNQLQDEAVGFKRIEKTSDGVTDEVGGKFVTFPIKVKRNHGIGYRNELEILPAAGQQGYESVRIGLKYGYGRVRLTGQTIKLAAKNYQAFANAMDLEMNGIKADIAKDTNRIFYGDGRGTLATTTAASTGNVLTVASTKYMELDMQIDIVAPDGTVRGANRKVTAVGDTTITFDGAAVGTVAAGDLVVRQGNFGREPHGLASLVTDTGVLFNVDPTLVPQWKATRDTNGGVNRALSEGMLITNTDKVRVKGGKTSLILAGLGVRRAYFNLLSQQRRYTNTKEFAGGMQGLAFHNGREIPFVDDPDMPDNMIYGLDEDTFKIYRESPWSWMDQDGSIWKWVDDFDAYQALMVQYWELGINRRNANFVITDVSEG
jgi:hypothetical protein